MNKRPTSITVIAWIFIAFGAIAFLGGLGPTVDPAAAQRIAESKPQHPFYHAAIHVLRILAVVGGGLMLGGFNGGRWLLVIWIAYHVILSAFHSTFQLVVHSSIFAVIAYLLFRQQASSYFRPKPASTTEPHEGEPIQ